MKTLSIDLETYSDVPLQKTGVYRYVESLDFEILLFAYSIDVGLIATDFSKLCTDLLHLISEGALLAAEFLGDCTI